MHAGCGTTYWEGIIANKTKINTNTEAPVLVLFQTPPGRERTGFSFNCQVCCGGVPCCRERAGMWLGGESAVRLHARGVRVASSSESGALSNAWMGRGRNTGDA